MKMMKKTLRLSMLMKLKLPIKTFFPSSFLRNLPFALSFIIVVFGRFAYAAQFDTSLLPSLSAAEMQSAIDNGLDINNTLPDGSTLLMLAAAQSSFPVVETLIQNGANVNASDYLDNTVLINAAQFNPDEQIISLLISHGAVVDAANKSGGTALLYAANLNPNISVIKKLLDAGADANHQDGSKITPLIAAVTTSVSPKKRNNAEVVKLLLDAGANPHYYYKEVRALDYAQNNPNLKYSPALQYLKDAMWNWNK